MAASIEAPATGHIRKRPRLSDVEPRERSSRATYVSKACQPCRRRKTKCNGLSPCDRCGADGSACSYDPSSRRRYNERSKELSHVALQLSQMQDQVRELTSRAFPSADIDFERNSARQNQMQTPHLPTCASVETSRVLGQAPDILTTFRGPTSPDFILGLATGNLQSHIAIGDEENMHFVEKHDIAINTGSEVLVEQIPAIKLLLGDPLQDMHIDEAKRLIYMYQNGPGTINPVLDTAELINNCERVFHLLEEGRKTCCVKTLITAAEQLTSVTTTTLKLVLANGSTLDSCGIDRRARVIFESVRKELTSSFWALPNLRMIQNWILVAILHYNLDEELQANRVTAHVARLCLELGINRAVVLQRSFKNPCDQVLAKKLVCNAFILDRRSSIGIGLPPVIPIGEMDVSITTKDDESLYLTSLVDLACILEDVYQLTKRLSDKSFTVPIKEIDYLEFQVLQWQRALPDTFSVSRDDWRKPQDQSLHSVPLFKRFILVLRANQIRNLIHRPLLYTTERIIAHGNHARMAIRVAREAIQLLSDLSKYHADILQKNVLLFKYFLISAFSVLLLAIANFPNAGLQPHSNESLHASDSVLKEFYIAIDLFKLLSFRSPVMATLWKAVESLQTLVVQVGVESVPRQNDVAEMNNSSRHVEYGANGTREEPRVDDGPISLAWPAEKGDNSSALDSIAHLTNLIAPSEVGNDGFMAIDPYDDILAFFSQDSNLYSGF